MSDDVCLPDDRGSQRSHRRCIEDVWSRTEKIKRRVKRRALGRGKAREPREIADGVDRRDLPRRASAP